MITLLKAMTVKLKSINFYIKLDYMKIMLYNLFNIVKVVMSLVFY